MINSPGKSGGQELKPERNGGTTSKNRPSIEGEKNDSKQSASMSGPRRPSVT